MIREGRLGRGLAVGGIGRLGRSLGLVGWLVEAIGCWGRCQMGSLGHESAYKAFRRLISLPANTLQKSDERRLQIDKGCARAASFFCEVRHVL